MLSYILLHNFIFLNKLYLCRYWVYPITTSRKYKFKFYFILIMNAKISFYLQPHVFFSYSTTYNIQFDSMVLYLSSYSDSTIISFYVLYKWYYIIWISYFIEIWTKAFFVQIPQAISKWVGGVSLRGVCNWRVRGKTPSYQKFLKCKYFFI